MSEEMSRTPGPWWCILLVSVPCLEVRKASLRSHHTAYDPALRVDLVTVRRCLEQCREQQLYFFRWEFQEKPLDLGVPIRLWGFEFHFPFVCDSMFENNKARLCSYFRWGLFIRYQVALKTTELLCKRESPCIRISVSFLLKSVSTRTFQDQDFSFWWWHYPKRARAERRNAKSCLSNCNH